MKLQIIAQRACLTAARHWTLRLLCVSTVTLSLCSTSWAAKPHRSQAKAADAKSDTTSTDAADSAAKATATVPGPPASAPQQAASASTTDPPLIELVDKQQGGGHPGPLYHQIMRQAFLATARDEFGAVTFDGTLRESVPEELSARVQTCEVLSNFTPPRVNVEVTLNRLQAGQRQEVWKKQFTIEKPNGDGMEKQLARAERAMHGEFFDALRDQGLNPHPHAWRDSAPVPQGLDSLMQDLSLPSQFEAARQLHALIQNDAESPERLSALARAYVNLGMLTEHFWTTSTKALTARGLLYSERLATRQPDSAAAQWCRGYVLAIAGRQHTALPAFETARQLAAKQNLTVPSWAALAEAYCKFDTKTLSNSESREIPLARWLYFMAVEPSDVPQFLSAAVDRLLEKCPDAYRAIDIMGDQKNWATRSQGAQTGHIVAGNLVYSQLRALNDLPAATKQVCGRAASTKDDAPAEHKLRGELFASLRAAGGRSQDRGEPSWPALATLLEDVAFVQVGRSLNARSGSLDEMWPLVADHPYANLFKGYTQDQQVLADVIAQVKSLDNHGLRLNAFRLFDPFFNIDKEELYLKPGRPIFHRADDTYHDRWTILARATERFRTGALVDPLDHLAPHMPATVAGALAHQHDQAAPHVAEWEHDYADNPDVLLALGRFYRDAGKTDDAARVWQHEAKLYPDREVYLLLAETYLNEGDEDRWLATWNEYFDKVPDVGLDHAQSANTIARYFMKRRSWEKASPYAERAADSGASWGLITAGDCAEALGKFADAQERFARDTRAYSNRAHSWYWFCRRTGYGDLAAAREVMQRAMAQNDPAAYPRAPFSFALFYAMDHKASEAYQGLKQLVEHEQATVLRLHLAILADQLKDDAARDEWLRKVLVESPLHVAEGIKRPEIELISLAELITDDLAAGGKGTIDLSDAARRIASAPFEYRSDFYCLLGEYLDGHGQPSKATECWKQAMLDAEIANGYRTLAGARLIERKVSPADYTRDLQTPISKDTPSPPKLRHPPDAVELGGHYYKFFLAERPSWSEAKQLAQYMGGQLAAVTSEDQQKLVAKLSGGKIAWLGGFREQGEWKWVSGEPFRYTHWYRRNINLSYARMIADGNWAGGRDEPGDTAGFVCQWDR
jgi:tetratricopeptide (TPR) repeat protein